MKLSVMLMYLGSVKSLICMIILMMVFAELGRRFRLSGSAKKNLKANSDISGPVETVLFAVLGLLMAFTFTGAGSRFEARRMLVGVEANKISTAYSRIDLLSKEVQPQMRDLFKQYTLIRANMYRNITSEADVRLRLESSSKLQKQIWNMALEGCRTTKLPDHCEKLMLPALNEMSDIATTRLVALENHPPDAIYLLLIFLGLFSAFLIGYDLPLNNKRPMFYMVSYSIIISVILYLIFEIELPNHGFINVSEIEHVLLDLEKSM